MSNKPRKMTLEKKHNLTGWAFLAPATFLIAVFSFWPMIKALVLSFQTGKGRNMQMAGFTNYIRMFQDDVFLQSIKNTFFYFILQVPIMLVVAMVLACILNKKDLRFKGFFRTMIFLPCTTSLVAYAIIFRSLFANDGLVNYVLVNLGILDKPYNFLTQPFAAKMVIILALLWRWTGYNMVFFLSGLQNIEYSVYEAAKIDGASAIQTFFKITVPLLKPTILLTAIMSTNGTLQLFDESINLTDGGPANASISMSHYIYNLCFKYVPNFGYAAAMSFFILLLVAVLAFIQMRVGDKRVSKGVLSLGSHLGENLKNLLANQDVGAALVNSFKYAILLTIVSMVICSLAGYGFEIYHDKAKDAVMGVILLAMMVPFITILVPLFQMVAKMKMLNSTLGFILPTVSTPFLIMMFRQSARSFPRDIIEAARLDGLSEIRIFFQMFIPTMKSTYAAAMTITFMNAWNSYMWPKVIMTQSKSMTMPMVVANLTEGYVTDYGMLMLAVLICTLPTALVFFILQKNFAEGITGAVK